MKKKIFFGLFIACCVILGSCHVQTLTCLEPYHSKYSLSEHIPITGQDDISVNSHLFISDLYDFSEPGTDYGNDYSVYEIHVGSFQDTGTIVKLDSVMITECGVPLISSVFYVKYPGAGLPKLDTIPFLVTGGMSYSFYVKIKKRLSDIQEMSIMYKIIIDGESITKHHHFRKEYSLSTKHIKLFKYFMRTCED